MRCKAKVVFFLVAQLKQPLHGLALHLDLEVNAIALSFVQGAGVQGILHVLAACFVLEKPFGTSRCVCIIPTMQLVPVERKGGLSEIVTRFRCKRNFGQRLIGNALA